MKTSPARRWLALSAVTLVIGCASAPPAPQDQFYRLLVDEQRVPAMGRALDGTVLVRRFNADGLLDQRAIAFADAALPQALKQYSYHFWSAPPPRLLQDFAVDYLRSARVAARVVSPEVGIDGEYEIFGRIRRLEHVRHASGAAAVSLELGLVRVADGSLLLLRSYQEQRPTGGPGPVFAVSAMNQAVNDVFARFVRDVETSL